MKKLFTIILFFLINSSFPFNVYADQLSISGRTMGTFYSISIVSNKRIESDQLKRKIDTQLKIINNRLSIYSPKSELSLFNNTRENILFKISPDFYNVLIKAKELYEITRGAWDGTVKPLVDLWGFTNKNKKILIPDNSQIEKILINTGFDHIIIKPHAIMKTISPLSVDLGSIAKGYGVDSIAKLLHFSGYKNFLVEIGGEIFVSGQKSKQKKWKVGINYPDKKNSKKDIYAALEIKDMAMATSGNYFNFITIEGKDYSHIINPLTGWPVENKIVSASVVANNCTFADGLATALMVMDIKKGIKLVENLKEVECMIIFKDAGNNLMEITSSGFKKYLIRHLEEIQ